MQENRNYAFIASTGRTATTLIGRVLSGFDEVLSLHEGHYVDDKKNPVIPPINMEHRKAWHDPEFRQSLVKKKRTKPILLEALEQAGKRYLVDTAYYNPAILSELKHEIPESRILVIFRSCESFVRSSTTMEGEDPMPVGWPDKDKELSSREKFIELGRLKPAKGSETAEQWDSWSAIQKNIWLWQVTNQSLWDFIKENDREDVSYLHYESLSGNAEQFWSNLLQALNLYNERTLEYCLQNSQKKENAKSGGYQIGPSETWTTDEQSALEQALMLESEIYG